MSANLLCFVNQRGEGDEEGGVNKTRRHKTQGYGKSDATGMRPKKTARGINFFLGGSIMFVGGRTLIRQYATFVEASTYNLRCCRS